MRNQAMTGATALIGAALLAADAGRADDEIVFIGGEILPVVEQAAVLATADLDLNGSPDLVVGGADLEILFTDGAGGFESVLIPTDPTSSLAVGDVFGNGLPDVVAGVGDRVEIHVNLGAGQFVGPLFVNIEGEPISIATGDFDDDGDVDIAVIDGDAERVLIVLNAGDGLPSSIVEIDGGLNPRRLVAADLNSDGVADLAITDVAGDFVTLVFGDASGRFVSSTLKGVSGPLQLASGDLNADGDPDLVVGGVVQDDLYVFLNAGGGAFAEPVVIELEGDLAGDVTLADLDGDDDPDIVVTGAAVRVISNLGGSFDEPESYNIGSTDGGVAADLTGDGAPDLALLLSGVTLLRNDGDGGFSLSRDFDVLDAPDVQRGVDIDLDGAAELVIAHGVDEGGESNDKIAVYEVGDAAIALVDEVAEPGLIDFDLADLDADGLPDLVTVTTEFWYRARKGDGAGGFAPFLSTLPLSGDAGRPAVAVADMNQDGHPDIVAASQANFQTLFLEVFENNGTGQFGVPVFNTFGLYQPRVAAAADVSGDGVPDLVLLGLKNDLDVVGVFINEGDGELTEAPAVMVGGVARDMRLLDADDDGDLDLAVASCGEERVEIWFNDGAGAFADPLFLPVAGCTLRLDAADFNGDGLADVAASASDVIGVWLGMGDGAFCTHPPLAASTQSRGVLGLDVDLDGDDDLLVSNTAFDTVTLTLSQAGAGCYADFNGDGSLNILDFVAFQNAFVGADPAADCNGDGALNILDFVCFQNAFSAGCS